ncbi:AAA family ATPase [Colletotrichum truncatum]|uniref:AAA family ATPase n=1 Tax=Colletotrichum truncatum TaxID=5467 RepID=A0ACC3ZDV3_COLTU|nr:AAA family ATPase [Colletotrichum truncatum]KAF6794841.1 AAA family ATPase [Colletotrichum truncatum]
MCPSAMVAFLLRKKSWSWVHIEYLMPIEWKEDPFISLQLQPDQKKLIKSLVEGFNKGPWKLEDDPYRDVIEGKGKGLIFLLQGPPGVGKTLTAESVAESTQRPLYHVSTGELSSEPSSLEKQLKDIFRLGSRWGAVVLFDNLGEFLLESTILSPRNAALPVLCHLIEYYEGMLFITTNADEISYKNPLFSHINVHLRYYDPDLSQRTNIWRQHLERVRGSTHCDESKNQWSEETYELLGQLHTNGREIRNYVRTAHGYAHALREDLDINHLLTVIRNNLNARQSSETSVILSQLEARACMGITNRTAEP